jgi:hypothetical protein
LIFDYDNNKAEKKRKPRGREQNEGGDHVGEASSYADVVLKSKKSFLFFLMCFNKMYMYDDHP